MYINEIDKNIADYISQNFSNPAYIFDMRGLLRRYQDFQLAVEAIYPSAKVAVSYKTNSTHGLLASLHEKGAYAEIVSGYEFDIAEYLHVPGNKIIFNGPMKTDAEIIRSLRLGCYFHCDNADEVEQVVACCQQENISADIGLRVSFHRNNAGWSRFGFDVDSADFERTINLIKFSDRVSLGGIHTHIGTNIRDLEQFSRMSASLANLAEKLLQQHDIELKWLDLGGGLAGISPRIDELQHYPHPLPDLSAYANAILKPLLPYLNRFKCAPVVFFEPGRTLFEPFGMMLCQIAAVRDKNEADQQNVVLNIGNNMLATTHVYNHPIHFLTADQPLIATNFFGSTCNQMDKLHQTTIAPKLKIGDPLLFYGVGAYCMAFSYSFIRLRPGILAWYGERDFQWLRTPETFEHMRELECIPQKHMM